MPWKLLRKQHPVEGDAIGSKRGNLGLQITLWSLWSLAVVATAYLNWHADVVAQRSLDLLGLIIRSAVVGVIGLVLMTLIEMHLEPWRFMDEE